MTENADPNTNAGTDANTETYIYSVIGLQRVCLYTDS